VLRLLEVGKLSSENGFACEVAVASFDMVAHELVRSAEIDDAHVESCGKKVAVGLFQSRAGHDNVFSRLSESPKFCVNVFEPRPTIGVSQRNAVVHFFDVGRRVKIIGVEKGPVQPGCEQFAYGALSCSGCAHQ
jgi:hypothetical protein